MPDLQMRFHNDMLVVSGPLESTLSREGYDVSGGLEEMLVTEEEALEQALRLQLAAGAQCLCTPTWGITRARLAHVRLRDKQAQLAAEALKLVKSFSPQHLLAQIGPSGLPLDPSSKLSLITNRDEYARAAESFLAAGELDAFFLNNLAGIDDARCALMGVRKVCATPVIASVDIDANGKLAGRAEDAVDAAAIMEEYEADVVGITTAAAPQDAARVVAAIAREVQVPILVQLECKPAAARQREATPENPYWHPDAVLAAVPALRAAGAQFVRAVGAGATPSFTGALVAASAGLSATR